MQTLQTTSLRVVDNKLDPRPAGAAAAEKLAARR